MFKNLLVVGSGSAGLMAALAVRRRMPNLPVSILRSPQIGVIGVGESTTPNVPRFLFDYLGIKRREFYRDAEPTWKIGIHFLWGPRESFEYSFQSQLDVLMPDLNWPLGYYCEQDMTGLSEGAACMTEAKAFCRQADQPAPRIHDGYAFHIENVKFVGCLEAICRQRGIAFIDGTLKAAQRGPTGIAALHLEDGRRIEADFFIDASGFRSELLGKTLEEPFISYSSSLFNDRAIVGSWDRTDEPTLPYTTAETMDAGWCWRIDHERLINRGYVFSSSHTSDDTAREEFARKNPRAKVEDRPIRFRSGRYRRAWVENVMAIGNASGFVEPLEATGQMVSCTQCRAFADMLRQPGPTQGVRDLFNRQFADSWDEIRDFLTIHYLFNTRLDTPYWKACRNDADGSTVSELLKFYRENGPTGWMRYQLRNHLQHFGLEGFLVMLLGQKVPFENRCNPSATELERVKQIRTHHRNAARMGLTVEQCLAAIRHPGWVWSDERQ